MPGGFGIMPSDRNAEAEPRLAPNRRSQTKRWRVWAGGPTQERAAAIEVRKPAPACTRRRGKPVAGSGAGTRQSAVMTSDIHGAGYVRLLA
jgi:hypothetical protein